MIKHAVFSIAFCITLLVASISNASDEIYLFAGNPAHRLTHSSPVVVYVLKDNAIQKVRTITTQKQNALFVRPYHEKGFVLIGSEATPNTFLLDKVTLDSIEEEQSFELDTCSGCIFFQSNLVDLEGDDLYMHVTAEAVNDVITFHVAALDVENGAPANLGLNHLDSVFTFGSSGGNVDGGDRLSSIYSSGREAAWGYRQKFKLGWVLPDTFHPLETDTIFQLVNNRLVRAITSSALIDLASDDMHTTLYIQNKQNDKWSSLVLDGNALRVRGFGRWVVTEEAYLSGASSISNPANLELFLTAQQRFEYSGVRQTGRLYLFDGMNSQLVYYETGNADSEVLLVDDTDVYLRVGDEIKVGEIRSGELKDVRTLAKSPLVFAVHWLAIE